MWKYGKLFLFPIFFSIIAHEDYFNHHKVKSTQSPQSSVFMLALKIYITEAHLEIFTLIF